MTHLIVRLTRGRLVEQPYFSSELHFVSIAMIGVFVCSEYPARSPSALLPLPCTKEVVPTPGQTRVGPTRIQHELLWPSELN